MKFDIIKNKELEPRDELPEYFLSHSAIQAEALYKAFSATLNGFAYSYAAATGLDKSDLFAEALIALAFAARDFDSKRSENFKTYAIYRIKDALNEHVRQNAAAVSVPMHMKKANANINNIKAIIEKTEGLTFEEFMEHWNLSGQGLSYSDQQSCMTSLKNIISAAERACVPFKKYIRRVEYLPTEISFDEFEVPTEENNREVEKLEAALIVQDLKKRMTETQRIIADGIMEGKTLTQIAKENNKTRAWASQQLSDIKQKFGDFSL